eukprot:980624_1
MIPPISYSFPMDLMDAISFYVHLALRIQKVHKNDPQYKLLHLNTANTDNDSSSIHCAMKEDKSNAKSRHFDQQHDSKYTAFYGSREWEEYYNNSCFDHRQY